MDARSTFNIEMYCMNVLFFASNGFQWVLKVHFNMYFWLNDDDVTVDYFEIYFKRIVLPE